MSLDYDQNFLQDHLLSDFDWGNATKTEEDCFELPMSNLMSDVSDDWLDPCGASLDLSLDSPPLTPEDHEDASLHHPVFPLDLDGDLESFQYSVMDTNLLESCSMTYQQHNMTSSFLTTQTNTTTSRNDDITLALIKATQDAEASTARYSQSTINCAEIDFENLSVPVVSKPSVKVRKSKAVQRHGNFAGVESAKEKRVEEPDRLKKISDDMAQTTQETKRILKLYGVEDESSSLRAADTIRKNRNETEAITGGHFQAKVNGVGGNGGTKRMGSRITTRFESPPEMKKSCSMITTAAQLKQLPLKSFVKVKRVTKQQPVITTPTSTVFAMANAKNTSQIPISSVNSSVNGNPSPPCSSIVNLTTTNNGGVKSYIVAGPQQSTKNIHPIIHLPTATGSSGKMMTSSNDVPLLSVITHSDPLKPKLVSTVDRRVSTIKIEPGVKPAVFLLPQNPKIAIVKQPTSISPPPTNINDAGGNVEQQMFKLVTNNSQQSKPVVLSNYQVMNNNTTTNVDQETRSKPLMGSLGGRKKPIVPAPIPLEPSVVSNTSTLTLSQLQSPKAELKMETCNDNERIYKKQQRMIKNRESASMSRQRRKQHVMDLEKQLEEMKNENFKLRLENQRLQDENRSFRNLLSGRNISIDPKKKSLLVLSLLFFMAFTYSSFSSPFAPITNMMRPGGGGMDHNLPVVIDSSSPDLLHHSSRQLLSFGESYQDGGNVSSGKKEESSSDVVQRTNTAVGGKREEFWIDDIVNNYKKESLERIVELIRSTSSVPLQRLLRRKLKEELGIRVPLFPAKLRRISSQTPPRSTPVTSPTTSSRISPSAYQSFEQEQKVKMPPPSPTRARSDFHEEDNFPCGRHQQQQQINETETSRLNSRLDWWISHHEVNRHRQKEKVETVASTATQQKKPKRKKRKARRKRSTVDSKLQLSSVPRKENGLAVYTKKSDMNSFWEAFGRQNDTIYVISMRKDQMLLPPLVRNLSSKTKLSLLLSAAPPNDTFANGDDGFMTMIKIDCEVNSSDYLRIRRDILPKDFDKYSSYHRNSKPDSGEENNVHGGHMDAGDMFTALTYNDEDATVTDATLEP